MKKTYETPSVEKVMFKYRDQVVVASGGGSCTQHYQDNQDIANGGCNPTHWTGHNVV